MVEQRHDLKGVAKDVLHDSLYKHKEFTGAQLAEMHGLNDQQLTRVKQYVKELAAEVGCLWGYDDYLARYRVCPDNDKQAAARMLRYAFTHWGRQGGSLKNLATGAHLQGLITQRLASDLHGVPEQSVKAVNAVVKKLTRIENTASRKDDAKLIPTNR